MSEGLDARSILEPRILSLEGVEKRKSRWTRGPAYFVEGREFVHSHSLHEVDIRLTSRVLGLGIKRVRGDARIRLRTGRSDWVTFILATLDDAEFALQLINLAWKANRRA